MELSDKAYSTLNILRNATWLNDDLDILEACSEVFNYLMEQEYNKPTEYEPPVPRDGEDAKEAGL